MYCFSKQLLINTQLYTCICVSLNCRTERIQWMFAMAWGCTMVYAARSVVPLCAVAISTELNWNKAQTVSLFAPTVLSFCNFFYFSLQSCHCKCSILYFCWFFSLCAPYMLTGNNARCLLLGIRTYTDSWGLLW